MSQADGSCPTDGPQRPPGARSRPVVLHVTQPTEAGVAEVVRALVAYQAQQLAWEVHVACPALGPLASVVRQLGAIWHPWDARRAPGPSVFTEAYALRRIVRRTAPNVVHLHSSKAGLVGRLVVRAALPTIFQPHAWSFHAGSALLAAASKQWERLASRWTHVLACVSEAELAEGRGIGIAPRHHAVVPNGVDLSHFVPADRVSARVKLGLPPNTPVALCVGRLSVQKGQDRLLDFWPDIAAAVPGSRLMLVGDGPLRAALEEHRRADVHLTGSSDRTSDYYAAADVFVLPSRWEGMPLVLLEAMACGRGIIAFDVAGAAACLDDIGAVFAQRDEQGFKDAVVRRLSEPGLADAEGSALRRRAESHFDVHRQVRDLTAVYAIASQR